MTKSFEADVADDAGVLVVHRDSPFRVEEPPVPK